MRGDDTVSDGMSDGAVLFLFDFEHRAVLEGPLDDVGVWRCTLDGLALGDGRPEGGEGLQLDVMPNLGEWCADDGTLADAGGSRNRHFDCVFGGAQLVYGKKMY